MQTAVVVIGNNMGNLQLTEMEVRNVVHYNIQYQLIIFRSRSIYHEHGASTTWTCQCYLFDFQPYGRNWNFRHPFIDRLPLWLNWPFALHLGGWNRHRICWCGCLSRIWDRLASKRRREELSRVRFHQTEVPGYRHVCLLGHASRLGRRIFCHLRRVYLARCECGGHSMEPERH